MQSIARVFDRFMGRNGEQVMIERANELGEFVAQLRDDRDRWRERAITASAKLEAAQQFIVEQRTELDRERARLAIATNSHAMASALLENIGFLRKGVAANMQEAGRAVELSPEELQRRISDMNPLVLREDERVDDGERDAA